jgi:hypothetical protein
MRRRHPRYKYTYNFNTSRDSAIEENHVVGRRTEKKDEGS